MTDATQYTPEPDWVAPEAPSFEPPEAPAGEPLEGSSVSEDRPDSPDLRESQVNAPDPTLPPSSRYPGGRYSPERLPDAEIWHAHPDPPPPGPALRRRLWWVLPFGASMLAGVAYVAAIQLVPTTQPRADLTGTICFVTTWVAVVFAVLIGARDWYGERRMLSSEAWAQVRAPSVTVGVCVALFGVAPTITWILLAAR